MPDKPDNSAPPRGGEYAGSLTAAQHGPRAIKANSSGWIHRTFRGMAGFGWQDGYGVFTVSASQIDRLRRYVEEQETHHKTRSFQEEFIALLEAHGIEYDQRYLWA